MPMDLGTRNTLLCDFMHCMTAVSLEMSDEPHLILRKSTDKGLKNYYINPSKTPTNNDKNTFKRRVCNSQEISWL